MWRIVLSLWIWLAAGTAIAFEARSILDAKLQAAQGAYPCILRGAVTARLSTEEFYIQDNSSGVKVSSAAYLLKDGDRLEVEGWLYLDDGGEFVLRAIHVWYLAHGPPVPPRLIDLADAHAGSFQGQLVGVRGAVLNVEFGPRYDSISIQHGRTSIRVFCPANQGGLSAFERVYPGMQVAVAGISAPQTAAPEFDGYQVRLRDPADLVIRSALAGSSAQRAPPWLGAMGALLFAGAVAWIYSSSRQRRSPDASRVQ